MRPSYQSPSYHRANAKDLLIPILTRDIEAFDRSLAGGVPCSPDTVRLVAEHGAGPMVDILERHGIRVADCAADADGNLPVHHAASNVRADVLDRLLAHGCPVNARDARGGTPLHRIAQWRGHSDRAAVVPLLVQVLLDHGADREARDQSGRTPLWAAAHEGSATSVAALVAAGCDVHATTAAGPVLMAPNAQQDPSIRRILLAAGADPFALPAGHYKDTLLAYITQSEAGKQIQQRGRALALRHLVDAPALAAGILAR